MTLQEIIALSKAGYKKKDIDALIEQEEKPEPAEPAEPDEPAEPGAGNGPKEDPKDDPDPDGGGNDDEIKTQLEEARKQIAELSAKLEKVQKDNVKKDIDPHTDEPAKRAERMAERARSMM